jgi:hypothetical protein
VDLPITRVQIVVRRHAGSNERNANRSGWYNFVVENAELVKVGVAVKLGSNGFLITIHHLSEAKILS